MKKFRYTLDANGNVISFGYHDSFEHDLDGSEPFSGFDIEYWKKNLTTGEWIYLPDITPMDKTITNVIYDWQVEKAYITIGDVFRPGPHEFDCNTTWSDAECIKAIESKFPT